MRRIKIKKNVLGEEYSFFITIEPKTYTCTYTLHFRSGEPIKATITENFERIVLNEPIELAGYINGTNPPTKIIKFIKIPKDQKFKFKEEILGT